jgi:hypothetical protein
LVFFLGRAFGLLDAFVSFSPPFAEAFSSEAFFLFSAMMAVIVGLTYIKRSREEGKGNQ